MNPFGDVNVVLSVTNNGCASPEDPARTGWAPQKIDSERATRRRRQERRNTKVIFGCHVFVTIKRKGELAAKVREVPSIKANNGEFGPDFRS